MQCNLIENTASGPTHSPLTVTHDRVLYSMRLKDSSVVNGKTVDNAGTIAALVAALEFALDDK